MNREKYDDNIDESVVACKAAFTEEGILKDFIFYTVLVEPFATSGTENVLSVRVVRLGTNTVYFPIKWTWNDGLLATVEICSAIKDSITCQR